MSFTDNLSATTAQSAVWECFCDSSYYDLWAVRHTHKRGWGQCFHMNSEEEARHLTAMLNSAISCLGGTHANPWRAIDRAYAVLTT